MTINLVEKRIKKFLGFEIDNLEHHEDRRKKAVFSCITFYDFHNYRNLKKEKEPATVTLKSDYILALLLLKTTSHAPVHDLWIFSHIHTRAK